MGWADCGINRDTGEHMGYSWSGRCHQKGCRAKINHGLSYVCGSMHEGDGIGCGYYFCETHLQFLKTLDGRIVQLCERCYPSAIEQYYEDALAEIKRLESQEGGTGVQE